MTRARETRIKNHHLHVHAHLYNDYYFLRFCSNPRGSSEPLWRLWSYLLPYELTKDSRNRTRHGQISSLHGGLTKKFYASFVVQNCFLLVSPLLPVSRLLFYREHFPSSSLTIVSTVDRDDETRGRRRRYEEDKIRTEGSSGSLNSVMRYLLGDSKIPRRNPFSGSFERTVRNAIAGINQLFQILFRMFCFKLHPFERVIFQQTSRSEFNFDPRGSNRFAREID